MSGELTLGPTREIENRTPPKRQARNWGNSALSAARRSAGRVPGSTKLRRQGKKGTVDMDEAGSGRGGLRLQDRTPSSCSPLALRDEDDGDRALVRHLFETGLGAPLFCCGLPSVVVRQLITQQLVARERGHATNHPLARRHIVLEDGRPVGRLSVDRAGHPWYIVDVTVLPGARGRGIASELLARLKAEARAVGAAIELHVAEDSPALRLYLRNDFAVTAAEGPDLRMRWAPS